MTGAWAQLGPTGPGRVDTREECSALGGKWQGRGTWQAACQVAWERQECLRLGGAWTQINKAAHGGRCFAAVSEFALAQQCLDQGGVWNSADSGTPDCSFEPPTRPVAKVQARDAGKRCDSQSDCTYGCAYSGPPVARGADVLGAAGRAATYPVAFRWWKAAASSARSVPGNGTSELLPILTRYPSGAASARTAPLYQRRMRPLWAVNNNGRRVVQMLLAQKEESGHVYTDLPAL